MVSFYHQVIEALNSYGVRYLVVGGFAVNFHGYNRTTKDLDLWVDTSETNLKAIEKAMERLGYEFDELASYELSAERMVVLQESESIVELMPRLNISEEISFNEAFARSDMREIDGLDYRVISLDDLLREKARSKRYKDLDDYSKLMEARAYYRRRSKEE